MKKNFTSLFLKWSVFYLSTFILLGVARHRLLYRTMTEEHHWLNVIWITSQDLWFIGLLSVLAYFVFKRQQVLGFVSLGVVYCFFGIQFQTKMGEPLTRGLLGQMGGVFELSTSIQSASYVRSYLFIGGGTLLYYLFWFFFQRKASAVSQSIQKWIICLAIALLGSSPFLAINLPKKLDLVARNPLLLLMRSNLGPKNFLMHSGFSTLKAQPIDRIYSTENKNQISKKLNVIVLLMETFEYNLIQKETDFKRVMPNLFALKDRFTFYRNHFSPWPLSSKSIFSVVCSDYPYPSSFIEIRVLPEQVCQSWAESLRQAGYSTWVGYSGERSYDQMGRFFKAQGFHTMEDRSDFSKRGKYQGTSWGLDDRALIEGFGEWVQHAPIPFGALLIPINSHHPYWTPDPAYEKFKDPYENSFHYQDALIKILFNHLDKNNLWNNTIVIITGDHGRRFTAPLLPGTLPESAFHVPLLVFLPSDLSHFNSSKEVFHPTSHIDLGGSIVQWTGVQGSYLKGHLLSENKSAYMYYDSGDPLFMLVQSNTSILFNGKQGSFYRGAQWVKNLNTPCNSSDCKNAKQMLFDILNHSLHRFPDLLGVR